MRLAGGASYARTWDTIERYARSDNVGRKLIGEFLRELGPIGSILGTIIGHDTRGRGSLPSDLRYALDFLSAFADQPSVLSALQRILEGRGAQVVWPSGTGPAITHAPRGGTRPGDLAAQIASAIEQAEAGPGGSGSGGGRDGGSGGSRGGGGGGGGGRGGHPGAPAGGGGDGRVEVNIDGQIERLPRSHPLVTGEMIETPDSSNVHSFGFDNETHSLFVRFKDQSKKAAAGYKIKSVFSSSGGGFGAGRPHRPGALYMYHHVPARLFLTFIDASSKGGWVWDHLRIRGTLSGHQYDYALVGVQGAYVPRKATLTPEGEAFIPRTIFTDKGRSLSSPLPEQLVRPLRPLYPGGGSLGRPPNDGFNGLGGGGRRRR